MNARLRKLLADLNDTFWMLPAVLVILGIVLAVILVGLDRSAILPSWLSDRRWFYGGGGTGARTLLGTVAASTIGVAGTVFSITIAALTLAAGQMGPRLLRNFTRDRGNQWTLGVFLGTFAYCLMVLSSVRTESESAFVPHLALSVGILLAFLCVASLVYFVGHMASRINVDTVIDLVSGDLRASINRLTTDKAQHAAPPESFWAGAVTVTDRRSGYLQQFNAQGLADWAAEHDTAIRLLVRPGAFIFAGAPIALARLGAKGAEDGEDAERAERIEGVERAIRNATALGSTRASSADLEFAARQLVEVAVRALSPGINDPHTAISVLDRLGSSLCDIADRRLYSGVYLREEAPMLVVPSIDYAGLLAAMFHLIRQNAASQITILIRMLEVLTAVRHCEGNATRRAVLQHHADLVLEDAKCANHNPTDLDDVVQRHAEFCEARPKAKKAPA
ncbi:MAG: DUF2254 domain-containing protein [Burkholderiales bacterium]